jgi:hypothetical protein
VLTAANRQPAFAVFTVDERGTRPLGVEVIRIEDGLIAEIEIFREPRLVERFAIAAPA